MAYQQAFDQREGMVVQACYETIQQRFLRGKVWVFRRLRYSNQVHPFQILLVDKPRRVALLDLVVALHALHQTEAFYQAAAQSYNMTLSYQETVHKILQKNHKNSCIGP